MAGASISSQVLSEVKELREDVHGIDKKLEVHLASDAEWSKKIDSLYKTVYGNGSKGLSNRVQSLEDCQHKEDKEKSDKRKFVFDIKSGAVVGGITLAMSIIAQVLIAHLV